jgi:hypothetical protein
MRYFESSSLLLLELFMELVKLDIPDIFAALLSRVLFVLLGGRDFNVDGRFSHLFKVNLRFI